MTLIGMMFLLMGVESDEDVDGGENLIIIQISIHIMIKKINQVVILTAYHSPNAKHHTSYHTSYHAHDNSFDNHLGNNAHAHVHDNAQRTVASTTALSPL